MFLSLLIDMEAALVFCQRILLKVQCAALEEHELNMQDVKHLMLSLLKAFELEHILPAKLSRLTSSSG